MDSSLINSALANRDKIINIIKKKPKIDCNINWKPLPNLYEGNVEYSAEDGGDMVSEFDTFTIYTIKSWSKIFNNNLKPIENAMTGLLLPPQYSLMRISLYREIIEAKSSLDAIPRNGIALFDGSVSPLIAWWRPISVIKNGYILEDLLNQADDELKKGGYILSKIEDLFDEKILHPIVPMMLMEKELKDELRSETEMFLAMEIIEMLYLYKILLEKIFQNNSIPVFISKTSRSTRLCNSNLPDVHIIKKHVPSKPGYLLWEGSLSLGSYQITGFDMNGEKMYPNINGISDFYEKRLGSIRFFARLQQGAPVLQIDALFDTNKGKPNEEEFIDEVLSKIIKLPLQQGYPTPLVLAHQHAVITHEDVDALIKIAGLEGELRERSMLVF